MSSPAEPVPAAPKAAPRGPAAAAVPGLFVLIWASGFIVARLVTPHVDPLAFSAARFSITAAAIGLGALALGARWPTGRRGWSAPFVAGFLMQGVYLTGVFWAVSRGLPAGIAALVGSLQPLMTALLARPLLGERVGPRRGLGIGLGFVGAGLVLAPKVGAVDPSGIPLPALGVCLGGVVALTFGTLWQKRGGGDADLVADAAIQFAGGTACAVPLALAFGDGRFEPAAPLWIGLAWAILVNSTVGVLLLLALLRRGAVARVAALFFLAPPVSAAMGFALFHEVLTPLQGVGMGIAALGVGLASRA